MKRTLRSLAPLAVVAATTFSQAALACPSCVNPRDANQKAFVGSTAFLSLVPLVAIFGVVYWVYKKARKAEQERDAAPLP